MDLSINHNGPNYKHSAKSGSLPSIFLCIKPDISLTNYFSVTDDFPVFSPFRLGLRRIMAVYIVETDLQPRFLIFRKEIEPAASL